MVFMGVDRGGLGLSLGVQGSSGLWLRCLFAVLQGLGLRA